MANMDEELRQELNKVTYSLMVADTMGDVHEEINRLFKILGHELPEGNFLEGFREEDFQKVMPSDWAQ